MTHDPASRDAILDRIEALEEQYLAGDHSVETELADLYDADETPNESRIWNVLAERQQD